MFRVSRKTSEKQTTGFWVSAKTLVSSICTFPTERKNK
jgi:hypothetical protein